MQKGKKYPPYFSDIVKAHLRNGTGSGGTPGVPGKPWVNARFAAEVGILEWTLYKVLSCTSCSKGIVGRMEDVLLGTDPAYEAQRRAFREAHQATRHPGSRPYSDTIMGSVEDAASKQHYRKPEAVHHRPRIGFTKMGIGSSNLYMDFLTVDGETVFPKMMRYDPNQVQSNNVVMQLN